MGPLWLTRFTKVLEVVLHTHTIWSCPSFPAWFTHVVFPAGVIAVPWLLDSYWRKLLMPTSNAAVGASVKGHGRHVHQE